MTSAYSTTSLPTTNASNIPVSKLNAHLDEQQEVTQKQKPKFIWKEPPNSKLPLNEDDASKERQRENKDVVMRTRGTGGGLAHRRKDFHHHTRRHTLQGGVDFSMVRVDTLSS